MRGCALFVAMTGTAYAGTQVVGHPTNPQTLKAKKKKKAKPGHAGPQALPGPKGDPGQPGSSAASVNTGFVPNTGGGFGAPSGVSPPTRPRAPYWKWSVLPLGFVRVASYPVARRIG